MYLKVLVEGIKFGRSLVDTQAFKKVGSRFWSDVPMPGCEDIELWTDEYWGCMARHYTSTVYHHSGTLEV